MLHTIEQQIASIAEATTEVNSLIKSTYGVMAKFMRDLKEASDQGMTLDTIESGVNVALKLVKSKEEAEILNKAYLTASKRVLPASFGVSWCKVDKLATFRGGIVSRNTGGENAITKAAKAYNKSGAKSDENDKVILALFKAIAEQA